MQTAQVSLLQLEAVMNLATSIEATYVRASIYSHWLSYVYALVGAFGYILMMSHLGCVENEFVHT